VVCSENQSTLFQDVQKLVSLYPIFSITFQLLIPVGRGKTVPLPHLDTVAEQINRSVDFLLKEGVHAKISFIPHCLLTHPEFSEKYLEGTDKTREDFFHYVEIPKDKECRRCKDRLICGGIPI